jgi:aspartyl-tRNA(Asn)/glutamyl-tRNA(Gln) amidotransferase subunit A
MVADYSRLTAATIVRRIRHGDISATELAEAALDLTETEGRRLNAIITVCRERALTQAAKIDRIAADRADLPRLAGVPVILKDNIVMSGYPTTCGSRMLESFDSPYDATCVKRLEDAGAVIVGKANMDEFAMGSSNENSAFGPATNPIRDDLVPGGSSGGSCAAVAAGIAPIAFGSDTGGSVRQPAGFCGVVGLKPTYGAVSRYGLVAFASSLDQIGPVSRTVEDCALAFDAIAGYDEYDATSADIDHPACSGVGERNADRKFRFGIPEEYMNGDIDREVRDAVTEVVERLRAEGHTVAEVSLAHADTAIAAYYIIANAEASSNLARYDGIRYGLSDSRDNELAEMYVSTRTNGFGDEVKRRIMLGTFALSAGYYDAYYHKASRVRERIRREFEEVFAAVDMIISPTSPTAAFKLGEKVGDPLAMYLSDILTVPASLAGIPAISIPCGKTSDGRPIGLQIMARAFAEADLLPAAQQAETLIGYTDADS